MSRMSQGVWNITEIYKWEFATFNTLRLLLLQSNSYVGESDVSRSKTATGILVQICVFYNVLILSQNSYKVLLGSD